MMANKDMSEKMMMNELGATPTEVPYRNAFCSMVCQHTIRPQDEIYEAHLDQVGKPLPEKYRTLGHDEEKQPRRESHGRSMKLVESAYAEEISDEELKTLGKQSK
jgi:hypothetical protein